MGKIMCNDIQYGVGSTTGASKVVYDNTESGLTATNVQGAIDGLSAGMMQNAIFVSMQKQATLITNDVIEVDFSDVISENCPAGYRYLDHQYLGAWPLATWTNAFVTLCENSATHAQKKCGFIAMSNQGFSLRIGVWYVADI